MRRRHLLAEQRQRRLSLLHRPRPRRSSVTRSHVLTTPRNGRGWFVRLFLNTGSLRKCASKLTELTEVAPLLRASHAVPPALLSHCVGMRPSSSAGFGVGQLHTSAARKLKLPHFPLLAEAAEGSAREGPNGERCLLLLTPAAGTTCWSAFASRKTTIPRQNCSVPL